MKTLQKQKILETRLFLKFLNNKVSLVIHYDKSGNTGTPCPDCLSWQHWIPVSPLSLLATPDPTVTIVSPHRDAFKCLAIFKPFLISDPFSKSLIMRAVLSLLCFG
uniref:Uncharacterized protein n=1 Tax=Cacopsylla melanoneura TaxID=428564 RepID=A0A8D8PUJ5_9HEMI